MPHPLSEQIGRRAELVKALLSATRAYDCVTGLASASGQRVYHVWLDNFGDAMEALPSKMERGEISVSDVAYVIAGLHLLEALVRDQIPPETSSHAVAQPIRANKLKAVA